MQLSDKNGLIILLAKCSGFLLFFLTQINPLSYSQLPGKDTLRVNEKSFSEELYIKTDRDLYIAGEKVWLKIYKLNGLTHTPVNLSKVAYVDLLDIDNNPVIELKIDIESFSVSADFRLPDRLRTGNYMLRSYTNWMQNFSKDLFAYKSIAVINPFDKFDNIKVPSPLQYTDSVIFYPEGGHLVAGIEARIGLKSFDKNRDPAFMKGALIDENNDTLCHVQTENNGYGWTLVKPSNQKKIFLVTMNKNDSYRKFQLPAIQDEGIILSVVPRSEKSHILVKINLSPDFNPAGHNLFLTLNSAGLTSIKKEIKTEKNHEINILRNDLPYGLSHLVIVDEHENMLTDRWIFNDKNELINYNIQLQKNDYSTREKIKIEISATDDKDTPVESDFSLSVVKAATDNRKSFNSNKYRQLPGLAPVNADWKLADMNDYLIFYSPHELSSNNDGNNKLSIPEYLPELEGHLISGNIRDRKSGEPLRNENISLSIVGKIALCLFTKTDNNGDFNFVTKEHGIGEIVIQPLSSEKSDCYVELHNPFSDTYDNYYHGSVCLDTSKLDDINNVIISMQINNIYEPYYQQVINSPVDPVKHNFYGNPDNTIQMSNYIELTSIKEIIKELVPSIITTINKDKINFRLSNQYQFQRSENGLLVLIDGVPVYDLEKVLNIKPSEIEKVDVLNDRYFISDNVLDGILHFITKRGNLDVIEMDKSVFRQEYEFMQHKNEFYSPDHSLDSLKDNHLPDFRNTLYWNPELHTELSGKTTVEFYSSDESAEYIINVEGITGDGKTGTASMPLIIKSR
jgi:hypothetical protein